MDRAYSLLTIRSFDNEHRTFEGLASTPDLLDDGIALDMGGAVHKPSMPMMWGHAKGTIKDPVGWITPTKVTKDGILVRGEFAKPQDDYPQPLKDELNGAWVKVRDRIVRCLSVGFKPIQFAGGRCVRWNWFETSIVPLGMDPNATIASVRSADARFRESIRSFDAPNRRAALGTDADRSANGQILPGAAGQPRTSMKTIEQRLEDLQTQRGETAARIKEINEGCEGDTTSLNKEDLAEFRQLADDLEKDDVAIKDAKTVLRAQDSAVEVQGSSQQQGTRSRSGKPPEKDKETKPEEKGIAYAQAFRIKWLAKQNSVDPRVIADQMRGKIDSRVPLMLRAAVGAGGTDGTTWGDQLVGDETGVIADFVAYLRKETIIGKFGQGNIPDLRRAPVNVPLLTATSGGNAQWVGEHKQKPLTSFAFTRTHLEPLTIAAMSAVSKKLLKFSSPSADVLLRDLLAGAVRERMDIDFIDPDKALVAGVSPASITNGVSQISAAGTGTAANIRTDVRALMAGFIAASNPPTTGVWIMSATTALAVGLMSNALGQPEFPGNLTMRGGEFAGLPVIVSEHVPASTSGHFVILANAQDIWFWDDGPVVIDTSEHASLEMSDDPENEVGTVTSMFQTNRVAFRAEVFVDWLKRRASSVQVLKNANWGEA